jgi:hypothetical protein
VLARQRGEVCRQSGVERGSYQAWLEARLARGRLFKRERSRLVGAEVLATPVFFARHGVLVFEQFVLPSRELHVLHGLVRHLLAPQERRVAVADLRGQNLERPGVGAQRGQTDEQDVFALRPLQKRRAQERGFVALVEAGRALLAETPFEVGPLLGGVAPAHVNGLPAQRGLVGDQLRGGLRPRLPLKRRAQDGVAVNEILERILQNLRLEPAFEPQGADGLVGVALLLQ